MQHRRWTPNRTWSARQGHTLQPRYANERDRSNPHKWHTVIEAVAAVGHERAVSIAGLRRESRKTGTAQGEALGTGAAVRVGRTGRTFC